MELFRRRKVTEQKRAEESASAQDNEQTRIANAKSKVTTRGIPSIEQQKIIDKTKTQVVSDLNTARDSGYSNPSEILGETLGGSPDSNTNNSIAPTADSLNLLPTDDSNKILSQSSGTSMGSGKSSTSSGIKMCGSQVGKHMK
jgi:hypothetical protein